MRILDEARAVCDSHLPGLLTDLEPIPFGERERAGNPGLRLFRERGGPALLVPKQYSGLGATPLEAMQVVCAIGASSPSLAVATAMHHFSVATIFTLAESLRASGLEWALLEGIADQNLLVSSGFAEGNPGQGILAPTMTGVRVDGGIVVSGAKRPCSMASSMDLLSASAAVTGADGGTEMVLLLVPAAAPGITVHPFWRSNVLAGAESDEVRLTDVFVDDSLAMPTSLGERGDLDDLQTVGFIWFELLITSCYLGMAAALVERVFQKPTVAASRRAEIGARLETAALLLRGIGHSLADKESDNGALARAVLARYGAQDAIVDAATWAIGALGGMAFISSSDVAYLAAACQCVGFHPPSRAATNPALADYLSGDVLRLA